MKGWAMHRFKKANGLNLYINVVLLAIVSLVSFCMIKAQSTTISSWEQTKARKLGSIVFAYVNTPHFCYKNKDGEVKGVAVDIMDDFVAYVEAYEEVKLTTHISAYEDYPTMVNHIGGLEGGVFGWAPLSPGEEMKSNISPTFAFDTTLLKDNKYVFYLPENSDWLTLMHGFYNADGGYVNSPSYQNIVKTHLGGLIHGIDETADLTLQ